MGSMWPKGARRPRSSFPKGFTEETSTPPQASNMSSKTFLATFSASQGRLSG